MLAATVASFLAGNAVVASYEIPSDNLIALKRAYHAAASTYTPPTISFGLTECISEGEEVYQCIFEESAKDAKWAASVESAAQTADSCMEGAEDMLKVNECVKPVLDIVDTKCSTETFLNACSMLPECISEAEKLGECLEESATDTKWAESIENASKTAESCLEDAENMLDLTECFKPVLEIADEKCPIEAALSACGVAHSVFENFVLDLAEDLKADAFSEDEEDMDFFDEKTCISEEKKAHKCVEKTIAKAKSDDDIKKWQKSVEKAIDKAEPCVTKSGDNYSPASVKCMKDALGKIDQYCPTKAMVKACEGAPSTFRPPMFEDFASISSADSYGLRGSSFEEE